MLRMTAFFGCAAVNKGMCCGPALGVHECSSLVESFGLQGY